MDKNKWFMQLTNEFLTQKKEFAMRLPAGQMELTVRKRLLIMTFKEIKILKFVQRLPFLAVIYTLTLLDPPLKPEDLLIVRFPIQLPLHSLVYRLAVMRIFQLMRGI